VYYISSDGHLVATPLDFESSAVAVRPSVALFRMPGTVDVMAGSHNAYKPSPDGQRFLISVKSELTGAPPINVILNWPQVLSTR
jgi:hypothetical protein